MVKWIFRLKLEKDGEILIDEYTQIPEVAEKILAEIIKYYEKEKREYE